MRNQRAESGERALDKALAEFRPGGGRTEEEKMRRDAQEKTFARRENGEAPRTVEAPARQKKYLCTSSQA